MFKYVLILCVISSQLFGTDFRLSDNAWYYIFTFLVIIALFCVFLVWYIYKKTKIKGLIILFSLCLLIYSFFLIQDSSRDKNFEKKRIDFYHNALCVKNIDFDDIAQANVNKVMTRIKQKGYYKKEANIILQCMEKQLDEKKLLRKNRVTKSECQKNPYSLVEIKNFITEYYYYTPGTKDESYELYLENAKNCISTNKSFFAKPSMLLFQYNYFVLGNKNNSLNIVYEMLKENSDDQLGWIYYYLTNDGCYFYHKDYQSEKPFEKVCSIKPLSLGYSRNAEHCSRNDCSYRDYALALFKSKNDKTTMASVKIKNPKEEALYTIDYSVLEKNKTVDKNGFIHFKYTRGNDFGGSYKEQSEEILQREYFFMPIEINLDELNTKKKDR